MAITDNRKIIIKVCKYYFVDGLSQKEISAKLSISRPQISRILSYARSENIVSVKINDPYEKESELEQAIAEKYDLSDVVVIKTEGSKEEAFSKFVTGAAMQLEAYIPNGSTIGVMSGRTLSAVVKKVSHLDRRNISVVPLVGGDGFNGSDWHANTIASSLAQKSGGKFFILNAPVIVENPNTAKIMKSEPSIAEILEKGARCDVALLGVGNIDENSTSGQASQLSKDEINHLNGLGAVASSCISYIAKDGTIIETNINERLIGQPITKLKKAKTVVIAMGNSKTESIKAVLNTGYVDVLFTNLETAKNIIE